MASCQFKEIALALFAKDLKAKILPHTHKINGYPYSYMPTPIMADNVDSKFPMDLFMFR